MKNICKSKNELKKDIKVNNKRKVDKLYFIEKVKKSPSISLKYLKGSEYCLMKTVVNFRKEKSGLQNFLNDFQQFVYDFTEMDSYSEALKNYSSHKNGSKISGKLNNKLLSYLNEDIKKVASDELVHLHLKRGGNGEAIIFGFSVDDCLYLVALDPNHTLI